MKNENFEKIIHSQNLELKHNIEHFYKNNIDWEKVRKIGELDYSQDVIRKDFRHKKKEAV